MDAVLTRRHCLAALCAAVAGAGAARATETRRYAVISLLGDSITLVYAAAVTGSNLDRNRRRELPDATGSLDRAALAATGRAIERAQPGSLVNLLAVPPSAAHQHGERFVEGSEIALPDGLVTALDKAAATHVVLLTKLRAPAHIELEHSAVGVGHLQGLGYYVDRNIGIRTVDAGSTAEGMLVAYAYLQLTLADATTGQVLRRQLVRATQVYAVASKPGIGDPWDMLDARQKAEHLRRLLDRHLMREIPALVASN
jgi:hypothetical protein